MDSVGAFWGLGYSSNHHCHSPSTPAPPESIHTAHTAQNRPRNVNAVRVFGLGGSTQAPLRTSKLTGGSQLPNSGAGSRCYAIQAAPFHSRRAPMLIPPRSRIAKVRFSCTGQGTALHPSGPFLLSPAPRPILPAGDAPATHPTRRTAAAPASSTRGRRRRPRGAAGRRRRSRGRPGGGP